MFCDESIDPRLSPPSLYKNSKRRPDGRRRPAAGNKRAKALEILPQSEGKDYIPLLQSYSHALLSFPPPFLFFRGIKMRLFGLKKNLSPARPACPAPLACLYEVPSP